MFFHLKFRQLPEHAIESAVKQFQDHNKTGPLSVPFLVRPATFLGGWQLEGQALLTNSLNADGSLVQTLDLAQAGQLRTTF